MQCQKAKKNPNYSWNLTNEEKKFELNITPTQLLDKRNASPKGPEKLSAQFNEVLKINIDLVKTIKDNDRQLVNKREKIWRAGNFCCVICNFDHQEHEAMQLHPTQTNIFDVEILGIVVKDQRKQQKKEATSSRANSCNARFRRKTSRFQFDSR